MRQPFDIDELARISSNISGVSPDFIKAQWAHETGNYSNWGAREANNFGGMKQFRDQPSWFSGDAKSPEGDNYQVFESPHEYATYFGNYLKKYVPGANTAKTPDEYALALKNMGYYGDSVENYAGALRQHIKAPMGAFAGGGANNSGAAAGTSGFPQQMMAQGNQGLDVNQMFAQFLEAYNKPKEFDQSILTQMEEAMKPTRHREQAMGAFMDSMIAMAKAGAKLDHPEALKEVMGSMQYMNQINMGYADQMEKEEQAQKRMKIGLSAMARGSQPGADKGAYGTIFKLATGQTPYEDPERLTAKDILSAGLQVATANRQNAYYDMATQRLANDERRLAMQERQGAIKQQPTMSDLKTFWQMVDDADVRFPLKSKEREAWVKGGGLENLMKLGLQLGVNPNEIAAKFGVAIKPRA